MLSNAGKTFSSFNTLWHIFAQGLFWARNQNNHQNFDLFLLPNGDVKKEREKKWLTQKKKLSFSKLPILNSFCNRVKYTPLKIPFDVFYVKVKRCGTMAIRVVEFSNRGYKVRTIFA